MDSPALWPLVAYGAILCTLMLAVLLLTWLLGERHQAGAADEPFESGIVGIGDARLRFPAKFYLVAMFFVIFDVEALFLFAWAIAARQVGWVGYVEMAVFMGVLHWLMYGASAPWSGEPPARRRAWRKGIERNAVTPKRCSMNPRNQHAVVVEQGRTKSAGAGCPCRYGRRDATQRRPDASAGSDRLGTQELGMAV